MEDSQPGSTVFSVRIVSIDYYMAPPIPGLDICYSSFQGGKVNEVPVIRIYGSTPAGQKTCLHVHRALPYFYIPCSELMLQLNQEARKIDDRCLGDACAQLISLSLEKSLKLKGSAGSKRQHVHGCSIVRTRKFYGYHSLEELFAKIYLTCNVLEHVIDLDGILSYYPQDISRAANLLLGGAVLDKSLQPHESHIPFLLQFLVDYNLYGMGHLHVSKLKFRHPIPNYFTGRKGACSGYGSGTENCTYLSAGSGDPRGDASLSSPIWTSVSVPDDCTWESSGQLASSSSVDGYLVKRQSTCELEGDAAVDEIINQKSKIYSSLSQTRKDVKMVQSLIPIWEEEYERSGMNEVALLSDPGKPPPEDVLRTLTCGLGFETVLMELYNKAENDSPCIPFEKNVSYVESGTPAANEGNIVELGLSDRPKNGGGALNCLKGSAEAGKTLPQSLSCTEVGVIIPPEGKGICPEHLPIDDAQTLAMIGRSDVKIVDKEALGLLSWLASSQAAEDINSDDELARETILTPLLPETTINEVLEKANMDFESESQQECQDILDSLEDSTNIEVLKQRSSTYQGFFNQSSPEKRIPQVDGSADDQNSVCDANELSETELSYDFKSSGNVKHATGLPSFSINSKRNKPLWAPLPFSLNQKVNDRLELLDRHQVFTNEVRASGSRGKKEADKSDCDPKKESALVECSVHDLMRRKRYYHFKTSEPERKASLEDEQQYQKQIDGPADDQKSVLDANELSETELSNDFKSSANVQHATGLPSFTINSKRNKSLWAPLPFPLDQKENDGLEPLDRFHGLTNEVKASGSREKNDADKRDCDQKKESALVECSVRDLMRRKRSYHFSTPESERQRARKASLEDEQHQKQIEVQAKHSIRKDQKFQVFAYSEASETNEMNRAHRVKSDIENSTLKLCGGASAVKPICPSYSLHGHHDEVTNQATSEHQNLANSEPEKSFKFLGPATSMGHYASGNLGGSGNVYAVEPVTSEVCACKPVVGIETPKLDTYEKLLANERCLQRESIEASPLTVSRVQSGILGMGDCICKNGHKEKAFTQMVSEISSANISTIFQSEDYSNIQHNCSSNPKELVGMTLYKKPPVVDSAVGRLENASSHPINAQHFFPDSGRGYEGISAADPRKPADELPHFFERDCLDDGGCQKKISRDKYLDYNQVLMGVPIHYQNDGSYLYMLTSVISPPSANCVSRWLSHDDSGKNHGASVEPASPEGSSSNQLSSQCSLVGSCKMTSQEVRSLSEREAIPDQIKKQTHGNLNAQMNLTVERVMEIFQNGCNNMKGKECCDSSLDISQISGPEGRSKPTPLSQTGFRDPASFGGGQQLTLLSMEVQAESRGELRPDPRFDAVNVIVLAFQEDNDCTLDIYVLLRSSTEYNQGNLDGISGCKVLISSEERGLFNHFINIICSVDPDLLMGWDIQGNSLGFLAERAVHLGINLLNGISRTPAETKIGARELAVSDTGILDNVLPEHLVSDSIQLENAIIEDEWGRTHASGVHVGGRVVLNIWRLMRSELKLNMYSIEAVAEAVLRRKVPCIQSKVLTSWFSSGPARARYRCIEHVVDRAKLNLEIMNKLDMINRTSELSRVFGIDFFSVLSRGSQYRVESMLLRLVHTQNYVAISPGAQQVASQPAMECLPLVMEPESGFYADPVVVLDFQSLYPSMIIAYNLCFCTCLGNVVPSKSNTLGVSSYSPSLHLLRDLKHEILLTPNGVMYVPSKVRKGVLPRLLEEILSTRIMVKQAMKKLAPSQQVLHRIFNARQLALKLIANVTYGYTAAGFSGRMPCAELADSIVQCGRRTLENAISFVNAHNKWNANVIYGDTDSMFVLLKGRTVKEAFEIGHEIASVITSLNPSPVTLKMEKVYHPCFLLTKKRYVGYSYENPGQVKPIFDAKGIETVRRDTCGAVAKIMEQSLRLFFEHKDIYKVREYLQRQWTRILSGRVSLQDFVFAKEVRLGTYSTRASSSLPPAAIVATKAMKADPRAEPRYAERVPYVVVHGEPGSRLVDMVVDPLELLAIDSHFRLNDVYYIRKQIIPALQRVFGLVGADLNQWYTEMPRPGREFITKRLSHASNSHRTRIDYYYLSKHCVLCGDLVQASSHLCGKCSKNEAAVAIAIIGRTSKLEKEIQHLAAICRHCGGGDWAGERSVKCTSLACPIFYERRKVQKELQALSTVATDSGLYPKCVVEWF